jgi:hypothetical protein
VGLGRRAVLLNGHVYVPDPPAHCDAHGDRIVWGQMINGTTCGIEPLAFNAIELLTLLGEIDYEAWRMTQPAAACAVLSEHADRGRERPCSVGSAGSCLPGRRFLADVAKWCNCIVDVDAAAYPRSRQYLGAGEMLETQYKLLETATQRVVHRPVT